MFFFQLSWFGLFSVKLKRIIYIKRTLGRPKHTQSKECFRKCVNVNHEMCMHS